MACVLFDPRIAWCIAFTLEALLIVLGNFLTLVLFAVNKRLCKRSLFLVINMAFADLLSGAVSLPILIYTIGAGFMLWKARLDATFYDYHIFGQTVVLQASLISAAFITCERFYAVYWPLKHRILSMGAYHTAIFMVWILAILFSILQLLISNKLALYTFVSILLSLLFKVCICNIAIWRRTTTNCIATTKPRSTKSTSDKGLAFNIYCRDLILASFDYK